MPEPERVTHLVSRDFLKIAAICKVTECVGVERHIRFDSFAVCCATYYLRLCRDVPDDSGNREQSGAALRYGEIVIAVIERNCVYSVGKQNPAARSRAAVGHSNRAGRRRPGIHCPL